MKSKKDDPEQPSPAPGMSLEGALERSEDIKQVVEQAADELTSINQTLNQGSRVSVSVQEIRAAIVQNESVEEDVAKAADDLHLLKAQIEIEIEIEMDGRQGVESELAAAKKGVNGSPHRHSKSHLL